jgi:hypothetical protein
MQRNSYCPLKAPSAFLDSWDSFTVVAADRGKYKLTGKMS